MIELDIVFYRLIANDCTVNEFEQLLYSSSEIENRLSDDDYLQLISIDFASSSAVYDAKKIVQKYVDVSKYYEWYLVQVLNSIIDRTSSVHSEIEHCYYLYSHGLKFLDKLAESYGLAIIAPPQHYSADNWDGLTDHEKLTLVDSMYPKIAEEARRILYWINSGKVILKCSSYEVAGLGFIDNRDIIDKLAR